MGKSAPQDILKVRLVCGRNTMHRLKMQRPIPYEIELPEGNGWTITYRRRFALIKCGKEYSEIIEVIYCEVGSRHDHDAA